MSKSFAASRVIRRIAARRLFELPNGKPVVLTIGVPQPVRGSHWGCAVQITGLKTSWRRPRYVFGIDGLQALHLAIKCAAAVLESTKAELAWLVGRLAHLLGKGEVGPDEDVDVSRGPLGFVHHVPPSKWCARRDLNPRSKRGIAQFGRRRSRRI